MSNSESQLVLAALRSAKKIGAQLVFMDVKERRVRVIKDESEIEFDCQLSDFRVIVGIQRFNSMQK
jgi:hypothetical protein